MSLVPLFLGLSNQLILSFIQFLQIFVFALNLSFFALNLDVKNLDLVFMVILYFLNFFILPPNIIFKISDLLLQLVNLISFIDQLFL
mmetsp:Transcript_28008/g.27038  ORF Transcript_28008/g.27038 Transcript_28008/m.27038 type:complete len:87 (-) Transcript_28008:813-1073(-)